MLSSRMRRLAPGIPSLSTAPIIEYGSVTGPARIVRLQYDSSRRIRELLDYTGRVWTYSYSDFNDLVAVTGGATRLSSV